MRSSEQGGEQTSEKMRKTVKWKYMSQQAGEKGGSEAKGKSNKRNTAARRRERKTTYEGRKKE